MKATEIWIKFCIGNYLITNGKPDERLEFIECALYKPGEITSLELDRLRLKLHDDLNKMIEHAKTRLRTAQ